MIKYTKAAKGVRYREHETRIHNKKLDRYYVLQYKRNGKVHNEPIGWASEGITLARCEADLAMLKENWRKGEGGQTLKEIRALNIEKQEKAKAQKLHDQLLTLSSVFEAYLSAQVNKNPKSIVKEKQLMSFHILPFLGDISIKEINSRKLDEFLKSLQEKISTRTGKKLSSATVRYTIAVLRQVWNYALTRDIVDTSFPLRAKQPREDNKRTRFLTREEANLLLECLQKHSMYVYDIALVSLYCGLRLGEIFNLQWGDVDLKHELIHVRDRKNKESGVAYLPKIVSEMLAMRYSACSHKANEYVFSNNDGTVKQFMSKTFMQAVNELGLNKDIEDSREKVVFHTLRHTFASWLAQKGVSMFELAELMGHKDIQMTQRYSHHSPDKLRKAAMLIEEN